MIKFLIISLIVLWIIGWLFKGQKKSKKTAFSKKGSSHSTMQSKSKELSVHDHKFNQAEHNDPPVISETEAVNNIINPECPYCHNKLIKSPVRKTKCPHCGQFIYIRRRPNDKNRALVTKDEADRIDAEWASRAQEDLLDSFINKEELESEREILRKRFGKDPSINDVRWGVFNKQIIDHAKDGNWGLYRNTLSNMAMLLEEEAKQKQALETYLMVCLLDLNGVSNVGNPDPEILHHYSKSGRPIPEWYLPFNPKYGSLVPGIVNAIKDISESIGLNLDGIKSLFMQKGEEYYQSLKLPASPADCWPQLEKELTDK